jgi:protein-disulfide isomerase
VGGRTRTWRRELARQRRPSGTRAARLLQGTASRTDIVIAALLTIVAAFGVLVLTRHASSRAALERGVDHKVSAQLTGIPQAGATLGRRTAPVTMDVFVDLEDPTSRWWFREDLPAIIDSYVRTGALRLRYHAFKRNTYWPAVFVKQQTAALAAGAQDRLWDYIETFFYEQGRELTHYVNESYLEGIARQTPGLNLARWHADRHTGRREEQTTTEDQSARSIGLYVTPAFRIGKTGGRMSILTGRTVIRYIEQKHPIALIEAPDIANAIELLDRGQQIPLASQASPKILRRRLE